MIITIDKNHPVIIMIIDNFKNFEYLTFIKNLNSFEKQAIRDNIKFKLYIDLFNLNDYSLTSINDLINYLSNNIYYMVDSIKIFLNKNNTNFVIKTFAYVNNYANKDIDIKIIELEKENKWNK